MRFPNHFDILAPLYDRVIPAPGEDRLAEILDLPQVGRLLDVGGGTGRASFPLVGKLSQVIVADESLKMLQQSKFKSGLTGIVAQGEALSFPDGCFERVILVDAFHHLADQDLSLTELWRVLTPGGRLVIEEPDIRIFGVKLMALAEKLTLMRSHFVTAETLSRRLSDIGAVVRIERQGHTYWVIADKGKSTE